MTNKTHSVLYIGVTNDLIRRVSEHRQKLIPGFTSRYNLVKLVYFIDSSDINSAIAFEKKLKKGPRKKKEALINESNPNWNDLYDTLL